MLTEYEYRWLLCRLSAMMVTSGLPCNFSDIFVFCKSEASFKAEKKRNDMIMKNRESVCNDILTERIVSLQSSAHLDWKHREQGLAISHLFFEILQGAQADKVVLREIFVFRG